jgi:hypothetical protein
VSTKDYDALLARLDTLQVDAARLVAERDEARELEWTLKRELSACRGDARDFADAYDRTVAEKHTIRAEHDRLAAEVRDLRGALEELREYNGDRLSTYWHKRIDAALATRTPEGAADPKCPACGVAMPGLNPSPFGHAPGGCPAAHEGEGRRPQAGDAIEARVHGEWMPAKVHGFLCNEDFVYERPGGAIGALAVAHEGKTWRWPSPAGKGAL